MICPQCDEEVDRLCDQCGNCESCCQCENIADLESSLD
jgi:hypothetical protein